MEQFLQQHPERETGASRVNPWNIDAVTEAMSYALILKSREANASRAIHKYVAHWARSSIQNLERACGGLMAEIFACTVGQKPRKAKYYLDETAEIVKMLEGLATSTAAISDQTASTTDVPTKIL
ncbi:hypothetical protein F2Q70_00034492 [Brassica cretica]|uniref:Uncharacterized protein n=1 Tax=Brassica cretica TaxID=69181 RepID=A0A8S9JYL2_BRACR|nr:hypothetical protein F2Q70_00034492 [Brassica cretica]